MAEVTGTGWIWLEMADMSENNREWLEWLERSGNSWKWLNLMEMAGLAKKWLEWLEMPDSVYKTWFPWLGCMLYVVPFSMQFVVNQVNTIDNLKKHVVA